MKRYYSLKGRTQFKEIFFNGNIYQVKGIKLFVLKVDKDKNPDLNVKIGISIKRYYGKANKRNLAKRRIRSICAEIVDRIDRDYNIIIRPEPHSRNFTFSELKEQIIYLLKKAGIYKDEIN